MSCSFDQVFSRIALLRSLFKAWRSGSFRAQSLRLQPRLLLWMTLPALPLLRLLLPRHFWSSSRAWDLLTQFPHPSQLSCPLASRPLFLRECMAHSLALLLNSCPLVASVVRSPVSGWPDFLMFHINCHNISLAASEFVGGRLPVTHAQH